MRTVYKIKTWLRLWADPKLEYAADYEVLVRMARRCAYDFAHATSFLPAENFYMGRDEWEARANSWIRLFARGNPGKDYRVKRDMELQQAESIAREAIALLRENNIRLPSHMDGFELPF
jgi:hypothetical protein